MTYFCLPEFARSTIKTDIVWRPLRTSSEHNLQIIFCFYRQCYCIIFRSRLTIWHKIVNLNKNGKLRGKKRGVRTFQIIHLLHLCCAYPHNTPESQLLDLAVTLTNFQRSSSCATVFIANIPGISALESPVAKPTPPPGVGCSWMLLVCSWVKGREKKGE